jgi:sec-independent protein translocase protein TatA
MGNIGVPELIIIFVVALIIFGPKKLPELGKSLGKGLAEFRRASNELKATIEEEVRTIEPETTSTYHSPVESTPAAPPPDPAPAVKSTQETTTDVH